MKLKGDFFQIINREITDNIKFYITLIPEHYIFKAHFPGNPIVPGVCQIQIVSELLEELTQKRVYLVEVKNIKYMSVLVPVANEKLTFSFQKFHQEQDGVRVSVIVSSFEKQISKMSLTYLYQNV